MEVVKEKLRGNPNSRYGSRTQIQPQTQSRRPRDLEEERPAENTENQPRPDPRRPREAAEERALLAKTTKTAKTAKTKKSQPQQTSQSDPEAGRTLTPDANRMSTANTPTYLLIQR